MTPRCARCGYDLRAHDAGAGVTCPECGRHARAGELAMGPAGAQGVRWWMVPAMLAPAAALVAWPPEVRLEDDPALSLSVTAVLFALTYVAVRERRLVIRIGTAAVLTQFLWLTTGLLARLAPLLHA